MSINNLMDVLRARHFTINKHEITVKTYQYLFFSFLLSFCFSNSSLAAPMQTEALATEAGNVIVPLKDIQRFATVVAQIKRFYVEPVSDSTLFNYAIEGMLSNLDPHSAYLDASALQDLQMTTTGKFGGIGIEVLPDNGFIKVISPIDDTPAQKAGMKPGDIIVRINDKLVRDLTLRDAIGLIRGAPGTEISLTVIRKDEKKPLTFNITREIIHVQTVKTKLLENHYAYLRVSFFQAGTNKDLVDAIKQLKQKSNNKLYGVILDLRNNPGGLLDSAVAIADDFLDIKSMKKYNNLIVYTKGRIPADNIKAKATAGDIIKGVPMVVLINEGSASASEIVAGALQDYKRAVIMGTKSFGKGSVQTVLPIDATSGIKLTTALYYTPAGRSIQAKGIEPDIIVGDLKIPKANTDPVLFSPIEEVDLNRHLKNGDGNNQINKQQTIQYLDEENRKAEMQLIHEDFQMYEALMLLKGLHMQAAN